MIDLSRLPPPAVIEPLDYETIYSQRKARFLALYPSEQQADIAARLELESEPMVKLLQENSYQELLLRQRINDAARAVLFAHSSGTDLDNLVAIFDVERLPGELDEALRLRANLSLHSLSVAGPAKAYRFHALTAHADVLDARATRPSPGVVQVHVLGKIDAAAPEEEMLAAVDAALNAEDVRPLTDTVEILPAQITDFTIRAAIETYTDVPHDIPLQAARRALEEYAAEQYRLRGAIRLSALYAALHQPGVRHAELAEPTEEIVLGDSGAPRCIRIDLVPGTDR